MAKHVVAPIAELPPGSRRIVTVAGRAIGVFNVGGTLYAVRNVCPHAGAPLCQGTVGGTLLPSEPGTATYGLEGRVLRCPWHGLEFDIATGEVLFVPTPYRVATYPVRVEDGQVVVEV
jgi:3-phenylpropionate/trans-cinnamate dioxygenase ferredoxin subunit